MPREVESLAPAEQQRFFHSLREEAELDYVQIYAEYRSQWRALNSQFVETFRRAAEEEREHVG